MDFNELIDRRHTHSLKWDMLEPLYGVSPDNGIPMWVADMDFRPPQAVNESLARAVAHGVHGYFGDETAHKAAIIGWMQQRHGWSVDPEWIMTVHGLVAGTALCLQAFTDPGDGVILFTPVYHAFARIIHANRRDVVESRLVNHNGRYEMDLDTLAAQLRGHEKMVILCSPHNPGGRVWSEQELKQLADFCIAHDLLLVSDEIHHDLVYPGHRHRPMALADTAIRNRLATLTSTTKTFNIAGGLTGNVIIEDPALLARFKVAHQASGTSPNRFGVLMATAAYRQGEAWLEALIPYLDANRRLFDAGLHTLSGFRSMDMASTYLAWVDCAGTGLTPEQVQEKVQQEAGIAASHGATFGSGGENFLRFNFATPRSRVEEAVRRLQRVFG
ncbi:MAG: pyridoxal phosphate-dependent aminotransferase [Thiothrix sp.]|nr:pyridoxal phosphate-dependent aminotransferase [Thiothrix sp.]HPE60201.1 MalY/PatB family protein [Thiolinea sp.]